MQKAQAAARPTRQREVDAVENSNGNWFGLASRYDELQAEVTLHQNQSALEDIQARSLDNRTAERPGVADESAARNRVEQAQTHLDAMKTQNNQTSPALTVTTGLRVKQAQQKIADLEAQLPETDSSGQEVGEEIQIFGAVRRIRFSPISKRRVLILPSLLRSELQSRINGNSIRR